MCICVCVRACVRACVVVKVMCMPIVTVSTAKITLTLLICSSSRVGIRSSLIFFDPVCVLHTCGTDYDNSLLLLQH